MSQARELLPARTMGLGGGRLEASLMLSLGDPPTKKRKYPRRLEVIRPKEGADGQFSIAARAFAKRYGVETNADGDTISGPTRVPIRLPGRKASDVMEARLLAFGQGRLAARGEHNYIETPELYGGPDVLTVFPLQGDPVRVPISGPNDPFCAGGEFDIPRDPEGKPAVRLVTSLTFILGEVGSFTTPCSISTTSLRTAERLRQKVQMVADTGCMPHWLLLLTVRPVRTSYRDDQKKRHVTTMHQWDLVGPVKSLAEQSTMLSLDEVRAEIDQLASRGLLASGTNAQAASIARPLPPPSSAPYPPALGSPTVAGEDDGDALTGEVVHNPDDDIPFPD